MKPLAVDLFCGRGGWAQEFLRLHWRVIGYDIKAWRKWGKHPAYPGELHVMDVRDLDTLPADTRLILASPPCTEFSKHDQPGLYPKLPPPDMSLVHACLRLAVSTAAPLVLENVRGLQKFLGPAAHHFGSFYLWGDGVPALLPHCPRWTALKGTGRTPAQRAMIPRELATAVARHHLAQL